MLQDTRDDILPSQIVADLCKESDGYVKYRSQFKPAYKHFISCVELEEKDFSLSRPRVDLRCNTLFQQFTAIYNLTEHEDFLAEIRPAFEAAIAMENGIHMQMRNSLQIIHNFYTNDFEVQKEEFALLGPELEKLQKNRPTDPERIQYMDKVMSRFIELQRSLKSMIRPGLATIQAQHLRAIRECLTLYQRQNEQWSRSFASFSKLQPKVSIKARNPVKKVGEKADKLAEDDRDV